MLGLDTVVLEGSNMSPAQFLPFWWFMHLIFLYCIDPKKYSTECLIHRVELMLLVAHGTLVDLAMYMFMIVQVEALSHELDLLLYGLLL